MKSHHRRRRLAASRPSRSLRALRSPRPPEPCRPTITSSRLVARRSAIRPPTSPIRSPRRPRAATRPSTTRAPRAHPSTPRRQRSRSFVPSAPSCATSTRSCLSSCRPRRCCSPSAAPSSCSSHAFGAGVWAAATETPIATGGGVRPLICGTMPVLRPSAPRRSRCPALPRFPSGCIAARRRRRRRACAGSGRATCRRWTGRRAGPGVRWPRRSR